MNGGAVGGAIRSDAPGGRSRRACHRCRGHPSGPGRREYAFSGDGLLAYVAGLDFFDDRTLIWVDRSGKTDPLTAPSLPYETLRISPVGNHVAFGTRGAKYGVWVYNPARGENTKVTSEGSIQFPIWTPDGKQLTYRATRAGTRNVFWRNADGSGIEEQLTTGKGTTRQVRGRPTERCYSSRTIGWAETSGPTSARIRRSRTVY